MSNPLIETQDLIRKKSVIYIGTVTNVINDKITILTENGAYKTVWGTASIDSTVLIKDETIIGAVNAEDEIIVSIP